MDVTLALLADAANVSREGKLNILGAFANINAPEFPTMHPSMQLVFRFEANPAEAGQQKDMRIILMDADGQNQRELGSGQVVIPAARTPGRKIRVQSVLPLTNIIFEKEGDYQIVILVNGETKAELPLSLTRIAPRKEEPHGS